MGFPTGTSVINPPATNGKKFVPLYEYSKLLPVSIPPSISILTEPAASPKHAEFVTSVHANPPKVQISPTVAFNVDVRTLLEVYYC